MHYTAEGNNVVPSSSGGTPIRLTQHGSSTNWLKLALGMGKTKCLSSQWGGSGDNAAVAYECGHKGLEETKQWWIIVPEGNTNRKANAHSAANSMLLAAQSQADTLHRRDLSEDWADALVEQAGDDDDHPLEKRDEWEDFADSLVAASDLEERDLAEVESNSHRLEKRKKHHKKKKAAKKAKKSKKSTKKSSSSSSSSSGTSYYIVPTDHLLDSPAVALTGASINTGGAKSTKLSKLAAGNKSQLWRVTKA